MTRDLPRAAVAGVLAGLAASAAMNAFQAAWSAATNAKSDGEPTTTKAADKLARVVTGKKVPGKWRDAADPIVHYATGAGLGLGYALTAEGWAGITAGSGTMFGAAVAAALDEGLVPALGLAPPPTETPPAAHAYALASHLVFGGALETARRLLRG